MGESALAPQGSRGPCQLQHWQMQQSRRRCEDPRLFLWVSHKLLELPRICFSVIHWQVLSTCILAGCEACWCQWAVCQSCCVASLAGHHKFWKFRWHLFALKAVPARKCQASEVSLTLCEVRSVFSSARHSFAALCLRLKTLQHWQAPVLLLCQHECC